MTSLTCLLTWYLLTTLPTRTPISSWPCNWPRPILWRILPSCLIARRSLTSLLARLCQLGRASVARLLGGELVRVDLNLEAVVPDLDPVALSDLVLVENPLHGLANLLLASQSTALDHPTDPLQFSPRRFEQTLAFIGPPSG